MLKLINKYRADPSDRNALAALRQMERHPMSSCMLLSDETELLDAALAQCGRGRTAGGSLK